MGARAFIRRLIGPDEIADEGLRISLREAQRLLSQADDTERHLKSKIEYLQRDHRGPACAIEYVYFLEDRAEAAEDEGALQIAAMLRRHAAKERRFQKLQFLWEIL